MEADNLSSDQYQLVICLLQGKDFYVPQMEGCYLRAVAKCKNSAPLTTEPVKLDGSDVNFNTEVIWGLSKKNLQLMRSNKSRIDLSIYAVPASQVKEQAETSISSQHRVGQIILDLREAVLFKHHTMKLDVSYSTAATWRRLLRAKNIPGRPSPSILVGFILEEPELHVSLMEEDPEGSTVMEITDAEDISGSQSHHQMEPLVPILFEDKGFFLLGNEDDEGMLTLYINVVIAFVNDLDLIYGGNGGNDDSSDPQFSFMYDLLGFRIETETFQDLKKPFANAEKASARIRATPENLSEYFSTLPKFKISLIEDGEAIAFAEFDWQKCFKVDPVKLKRGEPILYDGVLNVYSMPKLNTDRSEWRHSESDATKPLMGIRISLSEEQVVSTMTKQESSGMLDRNRNEVVTSNVGQIDGTFSPPTKDDDSVTKQNVASYQRAGSAKKSLDFSVTDGPQGTPPKKSKPNEGHDSTDSLLQSRGCSAFTSIVQSSESFAEVTKKFKLTMDLVSIQINLNSPGRCTIQYRYKSFSSHEISTSMFLVQNNKSVKLEDKNGFAEFSFSTSEASLQSRFTKHKLKLFIYMQSNEVDKTKVGTAVLDLLPLFHSPLAADFSGNAVREFAVKIPIRSITSDAVIIGKLAVKVSLIDQGRSSLIIGNRPTSRITIHPSESAADHPRGFEQAALEIELWKEKEIRKFKEKLQDLEDQHLSTLSKEWEKREKERVEFEEKVKNELLHEQKLLAKAISSVKEQNEQQNQLEAQLKQKEAKLNEREERLKKMEVEKSRHVNANFQAREKEFEKATQTMRAEILELKQTLTSLKQELNNAKRRNAVLKQDNENLRKVGEDASNQIKKLQEEYISALRGQRSYSPQRKAPTENSLEQLRSSFSKALNPNPYLNTIPAVRQDDNPISSDEDKSPKSNQGNIARLVHQRNLILQSSGHNESDPMIKLIDEEIDKERQRHSV